jgi:N-acetylmuramoyl-L-alanine amidase
MSKREVTAIVIHGSDGLLTIDDMHAKHMMAGKFNGLPGKSGYHYFIQRDGTFEAGRPIGKPGGHLRGRNHDTIGICLAETEAPYTPIQFAELASIVKVLRLHWPDAEILGHGDISPHTTCPNFHVESFVEEYGL